MVNKTITILLLGLCLLIGSGFGQEDNYAAKKNEAARKQAGHILKDIEESLKSSDVSALSEFLSSQTYLSLSNDVSGYYSANQAYYMLEDFFEEHQAAGFKFSDVQAEDDNVYGTGTYEYIVKGKKESAQVYISLKRTGKKWKITQISIN